MCVCVHTCVWQEVGSDGWQPRNLAAPCTSFKLQVFSVITRNTFTYTYPVCPWRLRLSRAPWCRLAVFWVETPHWKLGFQLSQFYQQLNFDYNLPYAFSPLPCLYHYTFLNNFYCHFSGFPRRNGNKHVWSICLTRSPLHWWISVCQTA